MRLWFASLVFALTYAPCSAQHCAEWDPGFGSLGLGGPILSADVQAQAVVDLGSGPALYVGGTFDLAGGAQAHRIARRSGNQWAGLGAGIAGAANPPAYVHALAGYDDGSGMSVYAGGQFSTAGGLASPNLARWDGTSWHPLVSAMGGFGVNAFVTSLLVFDDGSGSALYVGGNIAAIDGTVVQHIARWSGTSWSSVGGGTDHYVYALAVHDDGTGPALYASGVFSHAGGVNARGIAKWNGSVWSPLGAGMIGGGTAYALASYDAGGGAELYAGGSFDVGNARNLARWNGVAWSGVGSGIALGTNESVLALQVFTLGGVARLYAGGYFVQAGGNVVNNIASWDGSSWSALNSGTSAPVKSLCVFDDGAGRTLHVGGSFSVVDGIPAAELASWNGSAWTAVPGGEGATGTVQALRALDLGAGKELYAGGGFDAVGTLAAQHVARWDGTHWTALGAGTNGLVDDLAVFDAGQGPRLYAGGSFSSAGGQPASRIAQWDGAHWSALGSGVDGAVFALQEHDDGSGSALYVGGAFTNAGGAPAARIARWDGSAWSPVGAGFDGPVYALAVFDDGGGPALYAAGLFVWSGSTVVNYVARWDGVAWSPVGNGTDQNIRALLVHDDGSGAALYVAGDFLNAGGLPATRIAKWNGSAWSALGSGLDNVALALGHLDSTLYVGGSFTIAGGAAAARIAQWNAGSWSPLGGGASNPVFACATFDDGQDGDADVYFGGQFVSVGGQASAHIAEWHGCGVEAFCAGDGTLAPCPCANNGALGRGCDNSAATAGAELAASGTSRPDALVLTSAGELPSALSIFLQGNVEIAPANFGDGLRCAGGALKRLYVKNAVAGSASAPALGDASITSRSAALGDSIAQGSARAYQVYYRDPQPGFCAAPAGNTFNISSALRVRW